MAKRQSRTVANDTGKANDGEGSKLVRLELSSSVHQDFRVESAKEGLPMALMARRLVEEWIAKRKGSK